MCDLHEAAQMLAARANPAGAEPASQTPATTRKTISLDAERFLRTALEGCDTSPLQARWHMQTTNPAFPQVSNG